MARILEFVRQDKERNFLHDPARCLYTVFSMEDGNKYFQIDTFGRAERENPGKISQSIQLDRAAASDLIAILVREVLR